MPPEPGDRRDRAPVLLAVPLLLGPGLLACYAGGYFDVARLRAALVAWALLAVAAVVLPEPLPRSGPARAALGGLVLLCVLTGLSLLWAPVAGTALDDVQRLLLYVPAFACGLAVLRHPAAARLAEPLLLAAIAGAVAYGLSDRLLPGVVELERVLSAGDRLAWPLGYWNGTGAFAAIGILLAAGLAGDPDRRPALRAAAAAAGAPLGLALYLTFSRGALGALAAGLCLLLALAPTRERLRAAVVVAGSGAVAALVAELALPAVAEVESDPGQGAAMLAVLAVLMGAAAALQARDPAPATSSPSPTTSSPSPTTSSPRRVPWLRPAALAALALALAGSVAAVAGSERAGGRADPGAGPGRLASVQSNRYEYWRVAVRTFADQPPAGAGAGAFRAVWLRERPFRESVRDAHSLYLETAAELGLAGLALLALFLGGIATGAVRALRRAGPALAPAAAGVATWALHAGLDWDWELPALSLVALLLAARLLAASEPPAS